MQKKDNEKLLDGIKLENYQMFRKKYGQLYLGCQNKMQIMVFCYHNEKQFWKI